MVSTRPFISRPLATVPKHQSQLVLSSLSYYYKTGIVIWNQITVYKLLSLVWKERLKSNNPVHIICIEKE